MKTDFNFASPELFSPVVFRSAFNSFQVINVNQAWSLFFTGGKEDKLLSFGSQTGLLFTSILIAVVASGVGATLILHTPSVI